MLENQATIKTPDVDAYEIASPPNALMEVQFEGCYEYKGQSIHMFCKGTFIQTCEDFDNFTYEGARKTVTRALEKFMFSDEYVKNSSEGKAIAEGLPKLFQVTLEEARAADDLSVRITKISFGNPSSYVKITKRED